MKAVSILDVPEVTINSDGKKISVKAEDVSNDTAGTFTFKLDAEVSKEFKLILRGANLRIIDGDYSVELGKGVHFVNKNVPVQYWVALETGSVL
jgi:hypothetical protein